MFAGRITLFRLLGFEVRVDASWMVLAVLIVWSLAVGYFPYQDPGLPPADYWWMGVAAALGLFGSIVVHEFAHSLVARRHGLPMEGITLFIFGGVAEMSGEPPDARTEFLMAAAGPVTSVLIGGLFYGIYRAAPDSWPPAAAGVVHYLGWLNWVLAAFNSIPAFPLDGGRVLRSAIWARTKDLPRATQISAQIGEGFGWLLIGLAMVSLLFGNFVSAVWWFVLGLFLRNAAQQSYQQVVLRGALAGEPVRRFMRTEPVTVPPQLSLDDLVNDYIYRYHFKMFPVVSESRLKGCISAADVKNVPPEEWRQHSVQEMMQPCSADNTISPDADAVAALAKMRKTGLSRLMVVDHGQLIAILALKDLLDFLALKLEIGGPRRPRQA